MRALRVILTGLLAVMTGYAAVAADATQHISGLQEHSDLPLPSATRVVAAVFVTLALAAGTLVLVKRFLPRYAGRFDYTGNVIKVLARANVSRTLRVHVIEVDSQRVVIVEGRGGVEVAVLPQREPVAPGSELQERT